MDAAEAAHAINAGFITVATVKVPSERARDPNAVRDAIAATLKMYEESMRAAGIPVE